MITSATVAGQPQAGSRSFRARRSSLPPSNRRLRTTRPTRLWRAISELPHRQRQVLVLRYYLDQNEAEIADILRVSRGSVKKRAASRGLAALARCLEAAP